MLIHLSEIPVWKRPITARYLNLDPFWHKMIEGAPSSRALFTSSTSHDLSECWKMLKQPDFNAILIVVVENWLWELHDVEYHGVHLINLSKSSRFVSVNHMSERQKTGAKRRSSRERKPYFIRTLSKQIKKLCEQHTTFQCC